MKVTYLQELIYYCVISLFYAIGAIVSATKASLSPAIGAACVSVRKEVYCFCACIYFLWLLMHVLIHYRIGQYIYFDYGYYCVSVLQFLRHGRVCGGHLPAVPCLPIESGGESEQLLPDGSRRRQPRPQVCRVSFAISAHLQNGHLFALASVFVAYYSSARRILLRDFFVSYF